MADETTSKIGEDSDDNEVFPKEIEKIFDMQDLPKEEKHKVKRIMGMSMQMGGVISPQLELMRKMTPDHISEFLEGQREAARGQLKESRENKIFYAFIIVVVLLAMLALVVLLRDNPDTMEKVIYAVGGFVAGIFGGYGFGKSKTND